MTAAVAAIIAEIGHPLHIMMLALSFSEVSLAQVSPTGGGLAGPASVICSSSTSARMALAMALASTG